MIRNAEQGESEGRRRVEEVELAYARIREQWDQQLEAETKEKEMLINEKEK